MGTKSQRKKSEKRLLVRTGVEVADAFGVKTPAVSKWVKEGMPIVDLGGVRWYDLDEIYEWRLKRDSAFVATAGGNRVLPDRVIEAMPKMGELGEKLDEFKLKKADILAAAQMTSLDVQNRIRKLKLADLDDEELMAMTNSEAARWFQLLGVDFAIKYDKEALERSKGVDNVSKVLDVIAKIKQMESGGE